MRFEAAVGARTARLEVQARGGAYVVRVDGRPVEVEVLAERGPVLTAQVDGRRVEAAVIRQGDTLLVQVGGRLREVSLQEGPSADAGPHRRAATGAARVTAPMPGRVVRVLVAPGDEVKAGQGLLVMEAMKMENEIRSPRDGRVRDVAVAEKQAVETGALLATLAPLESAGEP